MATFKLTIGTDNAAFDECPRPELARILRELADKIEDGEWMEKYRDVRDINGNTVGKFKLIPEGEE